MKLDAFDKQHLSERCKPPPVSQQRLKCLLILSRAKNASRQWDSNIKRFDELEEHDPDRYMPLLRSSYSSQFDEALRLWPATDMWLISHTVHHISNSGGIGRQLSAKDLDRLKSPLAYSGTAQRAVHFNRRIIPNVIDLHLCSYCCNPSASLKKCVRCGESR